MKSVDKDASLRWDDYRENLSRATPVPVETEKEQKKRIAELEKLPESWFAFYFPNFYFAAPAKFHISSTKRLIANTRWYEVRCWSRELAKSTRGMMEDLYLAMTGRSSNFLLISHSFDNACELLMPYMINLESNNRLISDYGLQKGVRNWEVGKLVTRKRCSFRAIGAGQSPRGTRNEWKRPDVIRIDDIDTDERCRSERRVSETWQWIEQALIPTVSVSGSARIVFQGNLISKNSVMARSIEKADHVDIINIRDKHGLSSWPEKNTEEHIDWILSKISYISAQKEYYNNPISEGTVFREMHYKKMPPVDVYKFLVAYGDPSFKDTRKNDYKAVVVMGRHKDEYHILKAYVNQTTTAEMAKWYIEICNTFQAKVPVYYYIEGNATQDLIVNQIKRTIFDSQANLHITTDTRKKGDKFSRIETALEPINREGKLYLNLAEKDNPHMKLLEEQFLAIEPSLPAHDDGPDAAEGAKYIIDRKQASLNPIVLGQRGTGSYSNKKRF